MTLVTYLQIAGACWLGCILHEACKEFWNWASNKK